MIPRRFERVWRGRKVGRCLMAERCYGKTGAGVVNMDGLCRPCNDRGYKELTPLGDFTGREPQTQPRTGAKVVRNEGWKTPFPGRGKPRSG